MSIIGSQYKVTDLSMSDRRREVKGSPTRDLFKQLRKVRLPHYMFACDVDLRLIEKNPYGVVAVLDVKGPGDSVTFTEVIGYNDDLACGKKVFILQGQDAMGVEEYRFIIRPYLGGNPAPNPPTVRYGDPIVVNGFEEYARWEAALRHEWKRTRPTAAPPPREGGV